jgi:HD superfamily phosphohydrolase YqeK
MLRKLICLRAIQCKRHFFFINICIFNDLNTLIFKVVKKKYIYIQKKGKQPLNSFYNNINFKKRFSFFFI